MRTSTDCIVKMMFTNQLSKTGNLTMAYDEQQVSRSKPSGKSKWGAILVAEKTNTKVKRTKNFHSKPHTTPFGTLCATCTTCTFPRLHTAAYTKWSHCNHNYIMQFIQKACNSTMYIIFYATIHYYGITFIKIIKCYTHNPHTHLFYILHRNWIHCRMANIRKFIKCERCQVFFEPPVWKY